MHLDLRTAEADAERACEVCVIGSGAAGITASRRLLELGRSVLLLESGGLDYEPDIAALNAGENLGETYYDLEDARLRFFGGTTAIWGGRIAKLDPIDLQKREWVPHSGWPVGWDEMDRYYGPARSLFGLPAQEVEPGDFRKAGVPTPEFDGERVKLGAWTFDRRFNRFVFSACRDVIDHPRCTVVTHATITEIGLAKDGRSVETLSAASLNGRRLTVRPQAVVLAAGGVENPRLLLASRSVAPRGIGNEYDQVGRYFMEHPHARGGRVIGPGAWSLLRAFGRTHQVAGQEAAALIRPGERFQRTRGILNSSLTLQARAPAGGSAFFAMRAYEKIKHSVAPTSRGRALWMASKKAAVWAQRRTDPLRPWLLHKLGLRDLSLVIRAEQAPNPESRVLLSNQTDALGVPRAALDWRLTPLDVRSVAGLVQALDMELRRLSLGRVEAEPWLSDASQTWRTDPLISSHPIGGYHHMGTTRMSADPRDGVVDGFGRVHSVENLYVVGSSVFPTSGWANPTLTIAALALRTSEHLSARLAKAVAA